MLKELAQSAVSASELTEGKTKLDTDEVIKNFPDGITITGVDLMNASEGKTYPVIIFKEDENVYFNGGLILNKIVNEWVNQLGDIASVNAELEKEPVKVKLHMGKTSNKNNICLVDVI